MKLENIRRLAEKRDCIHQKISQRRGIGQKLVLLRRINKTWNIKLALKRKSLIWLLVSAQIWARTFHCEIYTSTHWCSQKITWLMHERNYRLKFWVQCHRGGKNFISICNVSQGMFINLICLKFRFVGWLNFSHSQLLISPWFHGVFTFSDISD